MMLTCYWRDNDSLNNMPEGSPARIAQIRRKFLIFYFDINKNDFINY
jgi:hypothetical protein